MLFGDAAGAVLLEPSEDEENGILDSILHMDGIGANYLHVQGGGSLHPSTHETVDAGSSQYSELDQINRSVITSYSIHYTKLYDQFDDYSKMVAGRFDAEKKARRRQEVFPQDCSKAYEMGVRSAQPFE